MKCASATEKFMPTVRRFSRPNISAVCCWKGLARKRNVTPIKCGREILNGRIKTGAIDPNRPRCRAARIFGFRHSSRLAILARLDVEKLSAPEFEFALLGVRRAFYRAIF